MATMRADTGVSGTESAIASSDKLNRTVAGVLGAVFLLAGLLGFLVTTDEGVPFAGKTGDLLLGLSVNDLHNIVHLAVGAVLLGGAMKGFAAARAANLTIGVTYLLVGLIGLFAIDTAIDIIALNHADNGLHLISGALLTAVALMRTRDRRDEMGGRRL